MRRNRSEAPSAYRKHASPLGFHAPARVGVVGPGDQLLVAGPHLKRERPLAGLGKYLLGREAEADLAFQAKAVEPAGGEHNGIEASLASLPEPRVDVAA